MKKTVKCLIVAFVVLLFSGCNIFFDPSSGGNSGGSSYRPSSGGSDGDAVTLCSVVGKDSSARISQTGLTRLGTRSQSVYAKAAQSTVMVSACYTVSRAEYEYLTSGFIFDKEVTSPGHYTYYVMTNASGVFYRYISAVTNDGLGIDTLTTVRSGDFEFVLGDGSRYLGELVGFNDEVDIAIFKFDSIEEIPVLEFADSSTLAIGQPVSAIGTPIFGPSLINSYVSGYISGLNRTSEVYFDGVYGDKEYSSMITSYPTFQFDAPINSGMEGGPVLNSDGEVIGMTGYKYEEDSFGFESLSMAIESNILKNVSKSIVENGSYTKPVLGITASDIFANGGQVTSWAETYGVTNGIYIVTATDSRGADGITNDSPAKKAGMVSGVIVIEATLNGKTYSIKGLSTMTSLIYQMNIGDTIILKTINHLGVETSYTLTV